MSITIKLLYKLTLTFQSHFQFSRYLSKKKIRRVRGGGLQLICRLWRVVACYWRVSLFVRESAPILWVLPKFHQNVKFYIFIYLTTLLRRWRQLFQKTLQNLRWLVKMVIWYWVQSLFRLVCLRHWIRLIDHLWGSTMIGYKLIS